MSERGWPISITGTRDEVHRRLCAAEPPTPGDSLRAFECARYFLIERVMSSTKAYVAVYAGFDKICDLQGNDVPYDVARRLMVSFVESDAPLNGPNVDVDG